MSQHPRSGRSLLVWYAGIPLVTVGLLLAIFAVGGAFSGAPEPVLDDFGDIVFAPEIDQNQAVWWMWLGENSAAVANFGPFLESKSGHTVRRWTLTVHADGPEPLLCFQGILNVDTDDLIELNAATYSVRVRPETGLTWRDVLDPEQIRGDVGGLQ